MHYNVGRSRATFTRFNSGDGRAALWCGKPAARGRGRRIHNLTKGAAMIRNWRVLCAVGGVVLGAAGCATQQGMPYQDMSASIPALDADHGRLYFFRETGVLGAASGSQVRVNDQPVGTMPMGTFFYVDEPAGEYTITTSSARDKPLMVKLDGGDTKYVRMSVPYAVMAGPLTPTLVKEPEKAQQVVETLRYVGAPATTAGKEAASQ